MQALSRPMAEARGDRKWERSFSGLRKDGRSCSPASSNTTGEMFEVTFIQDTGHSGSAIPVMQIEPGASQPATSTQ